MSFALVIYIYAGMLAKGDSVTLYSIPMQSMEMCQKEAPKLSSLVSGSAKEYRFACVQTGK
jgi:hypothetical protein